MSNIVILCANPSVESFGFALANKYAQTANEVGHDAALVHIVDLDFDYNLRPGSVLEPSLVAQKELLEWADLVVLVTPIWWNGLPANAKAYVDRLFRARYKNPMQAFLGLVNAVFGRSKKQHTRMRIITTQDSPAYVSWFVGAPVAVGMRFGTFFFAGYWPVRHMRFTRLGSRTTTDRDTMTARVERLAKNAL